MHVHPLYRTICCNLYTVVHVVVLGQVYFRYVVQKNDKDRKKVKRTPETRTTISRQPQDLSQLTFGYF